MISLFKLTHPSTHHVRQFQQFFSSLKWTTFISMAIINKNITLYEFFCIHLSFCAPYTFDAVIFCCYIMFVGALQSLINVKYDDDDDTDQFFASLFFILQSQSDTSPNAKVANKERRWLLLNKRNKRRQTKTDKKGKLCGFFLLLFV